MWNPYVAPYGGVSVGLTSVGVPPFSVTSLIGCPMCWLTSWETPVIPKLMGISGELMDEMTRDIQTTSGVYWGENPDMPRHALLILNQPMRSLF